MKILAQILALTLIGVCSESASPPPPPKGIVSCLSWRLGVETNNIVSWATVPTECVDYVKDYMEASRQYALDVSLVVDNIISYAVNDISPDNCQKGSRIDTWILDVDDTCLSNLPYYSQQKLYGAKPYDAKAFAAWALKAASPKIPDVLRLFKTLKQSGLNVVLLTGRDDQKFRQATVKNLKSQGFIGYNSLILRNQSYKGLSAIAYKSEIRRQLVEEGCIIKGNVGDQWSDLQGSNVGNRTFKIPNPMYFVP